MKLWVSPRAPSPRRVLMFIAEKGIGDVELASVEIGRGEHRSAAYLARSPLGKVPVLELPDGRALGETRAICSYLEGRHPEPNLMGIGFEEHAFIEAADRRVEFYLLGTIANWIRHGHPGLAPLEQPQFPDFSAAQGRKLREVAGWLDGELQRQDWVAGKRFTIADITAFCALEFARGLMKFRPADEGFEALQAWRDRIAARPSAKAGA
ncbi:glutathione S-transferase family protein [Piscinibacter sakaiensis]|uniref:Glutathione S-transferase n=1 Tax=Piscinibacter sakaiensis TaxID=1547922 RepID=A0A0K8P348_PISS1|nr:glutathione S-transferase family protein [Piscinibacter sakaiensis]GAP36954.1 glutathione S-transferase [Piscinibacter sakaiensis]